MRFSVLMCLNNFDLFPLPGDIQKPEDLLKFVDREDPALTGRQKYICTLCYKFSHNSRTNVVNHVESVHYPNYFTYSCDKCGLECPSKNNLQLHRSRVHNPKLNK